MVQAGSDTSRRRRRRMRRGRFSFAALLTLALLALLAGCERGSESSDEPTTRPNPAGAAPENYLDPKGAAVTAVAMKTQAPKPTTSLPKGASCVTVECHAKFTVAAQIHRPISEKACDSCHA